MEDNKLIVKSEFGKDVTISVIDIVENKEDNKKYIIYNLEAAPDDILISILEENDEIYILKTIEDENEKNIVENFLISLQGEE